MKLNKSLKFKVAHILTKAMNPMDYKAQFSINLKFVINNTFVEVLKTLFNILPFSSTEKMNKIVKKWNNEHTRFFLACFDKVNIYFNETYENIEFLKKYEGRYFKGSCNIERFINNFSEMNKKFNNYGISFLLTIDDMYNKRYSLDDIMAEYKLMIS